MREKAAGRAIPEKAAESFQSVRQEPLQVGLQAGFENCIYTEIRLC